MRPRCLEGDVHEMVQLSSSMGLAVCRTCGVMELTMRVPTLQGTIERTFYYACALTSERSV
jgi:hypothetical protein